MDFIPGLLVGLLLGLILTAIVAIIIVFGGGIADEEKGE